MPNQNHTKETRGGQNKITFVIACKRFLEQGREDIELIESEYCGWSKKSKFYDKIEQDYFWAIPHNIFVQKTAHPKRNKKERIKRLKKKYGVENISQIPEVKNKKKETFQKKYGTVTNLQAPTIQKKIKENWLVKYGTEYPQQSSVIKKKHKQTCLNRYGVDNYAKSILFTKTQSNRFIKETGEHLKDWLNKQNEPKPSYVTIQQLFPNKEISIKELKEYCHFFRKPTRISSGQNVLYESLRTVIGNEVEIILENPIKISERRYYYVDIFVPEKNIIIEYYGDYWHCNPNKYDMNYYHKHKKLYAKDIWACDSQRQKELEKLGYKTIIIWENDFKHNKEETISHIQNIIDMSM